MPRLSLRGLLQASGILTIAFSLLTLLQSNYHGLQLFTHFRLQYFVVASLLVVVFVVMRERRYAVLLFATAFINGAHVVPWYLDEPYSTDGRELRLLQANVLSSNTEFDSLFTLIHDDQPDVIVLQEVSPAWAAELKRLDGAYPHQVVEAREGNFGIAVLSRHPLLAAATVASEPRELPTVIATVDVDGRPLQLVGTHPAIPLGAAGFSARNTQLATIADLLRRTTGPRVVVGDLNASIWDLNYRVFEARTGLRNVRRGFGIMPTWPVFLPFAMIPIDHVLVSGEIGVRDVRTGPRIGSDHLPLVATITL